MARAITRRLGMLSLLIWLVGCSGYGPPDTTLVLECDGTQADLTIVHREVGGGLGKRNREVDFTPDVPVVITSAGEGVLCVGFDPANGGWKAARLSNFTTVSGLPVTVDPADLSLTPSNPAATLEFTVAASSRSVVKFDLALYRGSSTSGRPALLIDPVLIIKR